MCVVCRPAVKAALATLDSLRHKPLPGDGILGLRTADFDYPLDKTLIAQEPADRRDESRLLVLHRATAGLEHRHFRDLPHLLRPGDLLVLNDTKVIPARFTCHRPSGGKVAGLFLRQARPGLWQALLKNAGSCPVGTVLSCVGPGEHRLKLVENLGQGHWLLELQSQSESPSSQPAEAFDVLEQIGQTPLPPYIKSDQAHAQQDRQRYQTVYAASPGAVAAPTAGLHFTDEMLATLAGMGVELARVTLHVGMGTFLPVKADDIEQHKMHAEWYELSPKTAEQINHARQASRRIIAVGTTSVRVLETAASRQGIPTKDIENIDQANTATLPFVPLLPQTGWTDIFIYPPRRFGLVDALITNFHLPKSTLLMLISAFCSPGTTDGIKQAQAAYQQAQALRYRFFSYGDAMLID
jgi:S-adenosylmethionine:tRNA ribosyltransferase-isomerase